MSDKICYIIGAGECARLNFSPKAEDMVIAADGGYEYLKRAGIRPSLTIGDFDSLPYSLEGERIIKLEPEKDDTDALYAARLAVEAGYRNFYIYGGTGGRLAHTVANIQLLQYLAEQGGRGYLIGLNETLTVLRGGGLDFLPEAKGYISIFALNGPALGVTLKGLKYPLENYDMSGSYPIGTSNEFTGRRAHIEVQNGSLLIIFHFEGGILPIAQPFK